MKKVLVLGAGLVSHPIVEYLLNKGVEVNVADSSLSKAEKVIGDNPHAHAHFLNAEDEQALEALVVQNNLVVSLLPFVFHPKVAKVCIRHKINMVTCSYVKQEMKELDQAAKEAGVLILNEMGLDPGIDHMSAKKIIDRVHQQNGIIKKFYSFCGALPAPEAIDNPFNYRFSWSPRGVLIASNNDAKYLFKKEIVSVAPENLFKDLRWIDFPGLGKLEVYPNRDSLSYLDLYNLKSSNTVIRGTIRYRGWSRMIDLLKSLKLFSREPEDMTGMSYRAFLAQKAGINNSGQIKIDLANKLDIAPNNPLILAFDYLGLFSDKDMGRGACASFDIMADLMIGKMMLKKEERDMIVLQHVFEIEKSDGESDIIKSSMLSYGGSGKDTAIAKTVALPAAIASRLILEGKIPLTGVHIPVLPEIYNPVLDELELLGIKMMEEEGLIDGGVVEAIDME